MQSNAWIIFDCQTANQRRQRSHWDSTSPGLFLSLDTEQRPLGLEGGRGGGGDVHLCMDLEISEETSHWGPRAQHSLLP